MAKEAVQISVVELMKEAEMDFVDYFSLQKMHTFPACLQGLYYQYAVPMLVAIGPYHHKKEGLGMMELVKRAAAFHLSKSWGDKLAKEVYEAVLHRAALSRKRYAVGRLPANMADADDVHAFAEMMFFDACFLLHYMEVSVSLKEEAERHDALSKLLFSNRGSIDRDIMLLENQLPWPVVQAIIDCLPEQQAQQHYKKDVVGRYIARKGRGFNIGEHEDEGPPFEWEGSPQHLLDLLRNYKIGKEDSPAKWPNYSRLSAIELAEIGIKLRASKTALFTDMDVSEKGPFCCNLSLAPLSLNDTRACCLVNMAAFEVSTGTSYGAYPDSTAVCSYLSLFSFLMLQEKDVNELRAKYILHSHQSNEQVLAFFESIIKHLPDTGSNFAYIMFLIQAYKRRRWIWFRVHRFLYNNSRTIIKMVALIGTILAIFQSLYSLNKGHKDGIP
jgi:hypothetical protein